MAAVLLCMPIAGCAQEGGQPQGTADETPLTGVAYMMDTVVEYKLYGEKAEEARDAFLEYLGQFEQRISRYLEDSEISRINQSAGEETFIPVSEDTFALLARSVGFSTQSDGVFDITIAPLTESWNVVAEDPKIPPDEEIQSLLELVDYRDIQLDAQHQSVRLAREGQKIDLGGVAKGFACSQLRQIGEKIGLTSGYVSIGGNIMVIGEKPDGTPFKFGVRDPRGSANDYIAVMILPNSTMATSGDYERYFIQDGVRYHHILDPATGYPAQTDLLSVSVVSEDGAYADYMSTYLFIKGKEYVLAHLNEFENCGFIAIDQDKNVYVSDNLLDQMEPSDATGQYHFEVPA